MFLFETGCRINELTGAELVNCITAPESGKVFIKLLPYRFELCGIESPFDLMSSKFGSYGEMNNSWTGDDVKGFAKIFSNQMMIWKKIKEQGQ